MTKMVLMFIIRLPGNTLYYLINPQKRRDKIAEIRDIAKKEFDHYWTGSKLLMADVRTARSLLARTLQGSTLSRRERKQLLRTVTDLFRLVPFSMFILIPFMEAALPFAIRLFPNMLPSTFQDSLKSEENMKRELKSRIAMAQFFQETLEDLAKEQKRIAGNRNTETPDDKISSKQIESAASLLEFLDRARNGEMMPPEVIVQYANYFQDDLTLDNMPRMQLINMCKYMSIPPYGYDNFLRFQLRHTIKSLKEDDQRILWEGINSLTKMELREACQERGMRSTGLSKQAYKQSLQQWLDLSVNKNVPISLLVMSRTFFLQKETIQPAAGDEAASVAGLADAISGLDKEVLNEVILEVATSEEKKSNPDVRKIKLEVLSHQNEKIREEQAERESAAKKKESAEKAEEAEAEPQEATLEPPEEQDASLGKKKAEEAQEDSADTVTEKFFDDTSVKMEEKPGEKELRIEVPESLVEEEKAEEKGEEKRDLSADEIEALEGWVSADPVKKEKEDLERLKSAMKESSEMEQSEEDAEQEKSETDDLAGALASKSEDVFESAEKYAASVVEEAEKKAIKEAEKSTTFSADSTVPERASPYQEPSAEQEAVASEPEEEEEEEDMVVAKLKKRLESMVDKIEIQLSDAQVKIGDKLHFLDKDMDGILSREEIVESLQQVLRREITSEEAMEIVSEMDEDGDGVLTVQELIKWIDTNKLVKLESEGRDADMDRIMDKQRAGHRDEEQSPDDARQEPESGKTTEQSS